MVLRYHHCEGNPYQGHKLRESELQTFTGCNNRVTLSTSRLHPHTEQWEVILETVIISFIGEKFETQPCQLLAA